MDRPAEEGTIDHTSEHKRKTKAKGVLTYLASRQATGTSAFQDSQPGKIMHETRGGEMARLAGLSISLRLPWGQAPDLPSLARSLASKSGDTACSSRSASS